jgi:hypothetical protein
MGLVDYLEIVGGKLFTAFCDLFSSISLLTFPVVLFATVYHRLLHKFHLGIEYKGRDG